MLNFIWAEAFAFYEIQTRKFALVFKKQVFPNLKTGKLKDHGGII